MDLAGPEAHHLAVVCRLGPGDAICLFNGDGKEYHARVLEVHRRCVSVDIFDAAEPRRELSFPLVAGVPLPKGDRAQFLIEKLTELGVTSFVPLASQRGVIHPRDTRLDKLRRHVIEASKQCGRNCLMVIEPLEPWEVFCRRGNAGECRVFGHPGGEAIQNIQRRRPAGIPVTLAVGPEGGFTEEEVLQAHAAGWLSVDLGTRILRVETAALVLAATLTAPLGAF